jgi:hypothetical protein
MSVILAIDPGSESSGFVVWDAETERPRAFGKAPNVELLDELRAGVAGDVDVVVIEDFQTFGMPVGREVFQAVRWSGRFEEAIGDRWPVVYILRSTVRSTICGSMKAKDANVRAAIIERFGGKDAAIGRKASPGPLHGMAADVWSALALALTRAEKEGVTA